MSKWISTKDGRIKKRGDVYWARFMKRGQIVEQSLETSSFSLAKAMVENIESDILMGVNWKKDREFFETAWPDFIIDKANGVKTKPAREKTIREYIGHGQRFYMPFFKECRLDEIEDRWPDLVEKIKKEKPGIQFDNIRKYLMGFLSWAYRKGKLKHRAELYDPDVKRKEVQEKSGPGLAYTIEQLKIMRDIAKSQSPRFYLFMLMAQYEGMRPSEITQLKRDRIDWEMSVIRLRKADTKTKQARDVALHPEVKPFLKTQYELTEGLEYLFPNANDKSRPMDPTGFKKYWNEILENPEIKGRVYDFRHTFITHAIEQGMNPSVVARITGTSLKMIEQRYLHLNEKTLNQELRKFVL